MEPTRYIREEGTRLQKEVRQRTLGYIITALGIVAGLAWNEAIKSAIDSLFPLGKETLFAQFAYAIIVTIAVVIIATYLTRYFAERAD